MSSGLDILTPKGQQSLEQEQQFLTAVQVNLKCTIVQTAKDKPEIGRAHV